jgi:O-antigen ligase
MSGPTGAVDMSASIARRPWRGAVPGMAVAVLIVSLAGGVGVAVATSPELAIRLTCTGLFVMVAFLDVRAGAVAFTVPLFLQPGLFISDQAMKLAGATLAAAWLAERLTGRHQHPLLARRHGLFFVSLTLLIVIAAASVFWAADVALASAAVVRLAQAVVLLAIIATAFREPRDFRWLMLAFIAGCVLTAAVGLAGIVPEQFDPFTGKTRLAGGIGDPNELAMLSVAALVLAAFLLAIERSPLIRGALAGSMALFAFTVLMTESRGGVVAMAIIAIVGPLMAGPLRGRAAALAAAGIAAGAAYFTFAADPQAVGRLLGIAADQGSGRWELWAVATQIGAAQPLTGIGLANITVVEPSYVVLTDLRSSHLIAQFPQQTHNVYLQMFAELGIFGLAAFLVMLGAIVRIATRAFGVLAAHGDVEMELVTRALTVATLAMLTGSVFLSAQYSKQLWLLFGALLACSSAAAASGGGLRGRSHRAAGAAVAGEPPLAAPSVSRGGR